MHVKNFIDVDLSGRHGCRFRMDSDIFFFQPRGNHRHFHKHKSMSVAFWTHDKEKSVSSIRTLGDAGGKDIEKIFGKPRAAIGAFRGFFQMRNDLLKEFEGQGGAKRSLLILKRN